MGRTNVLTFILKVTALQAGEETKEWAVGTNMDTAAVVQAGGEAGGAVGPGIGGGGRLEDSLQAPLSSSSSTGTAVTGPWHVPKGWMRLVPFHTTSHLHISVKHLPNSLPILKSSSLSAFLCISNRPLPSLSPLLTCVANIYPSLGLPFPSQ